MALVLKSEQQILTDQIVKFKAETGITDFNPGSTILTLLEAASSEDFQQYIQMLSIIRNFNLDTTNGEDLDNKAFEFNLTRNQAEKATGKVNILRDSTFEKVATTIYSGLPAPIAGNIKLYVNDASNTLYGASGTLIVGRNTISEEEVTYTAAPINNINFFEFTVSPFSNDHGLDETVILKQGINQVIPAGTTLIVPASATSNEVQFNTDDDATVLAGEDKIEDVEITAVEAGEAGNIPVNAIMGEGAFPTPPFIGARSENDTRFSTGQDKETDDELRDRIKQTIQSLSKGTKTSLLNSIIGLVDTASAKRVVSASIVLPQNLEEIVKIFIDDGTGFEPQFSSQGFESLLTAATGGETRLQLDLTPLVKAQVETNNTEPFNMSAGTLTLDYIVGVDSESISFGIQDFEFSESATAEEIVAVINDSAFLIEARTSQSGKGVVITTKEDTNEDIHITGGTANSILAFPTDPKSTLFLYVDDQLLSKDGSTALLDTMNAQPYDLSSLGDLNIIIDGKSANPQTVTFLAGDFALPSSATAAEVATAINARLAGALATTIEGNTKVRLTSNTVLSSLSQLEITGGAANTPLGFPTSIASGTNKDYTLNRHLGTIELTNALIANQTVTAGSIFTRAFLRTISAESYVITVGETLVVEVDSGGNQTVTFPLTGVFTATQVATEINSQLQGVIATSRTIGNQNFLEITTNTYDENLGSIKVDSTSTALALNFLTDQTLTNQRPHQAFTVSQNPAPYIFVKNDNLIVVVDNDPVSKTFNMAMHKEGNATSVNSNQEWADSSFNTVFTNDDELIDFYAVFTSGANSTTETITEVIDVSLSTQNEKQKIEFSSVPNSGSFQLRHDGNDTASIAAGASTDDVRTALINLISINDIAVTGDFASGFEIEFINADAATNFTQITETPILNTLVVNEIQRIDFSSVPDSGDFKLVHNANITAAIPFSANAAAIESALEALASITDVTVTGSFASGFQIKFIDPAGDTTQITDTANTLLDGATPVNIVISTTTEGVAGTVSITTSTLTNGHPTKPANTFRYIFTNLPTDISNFTVNDHVTFENMNEVANDGSFIITAVEDEITSVNGFVEVTNIQGIAESGSSGDVTLGQRRQIVDYIAASGTIIVGLPFIAPPVAGDVFIIMPYSLKNTVDYMQNTKITTLATKAVTSDVEADTNVQIASKESGSDGYIQVTGGAANDKMLFSTSTIRGLQGYNYFTGLTKLVHSTVYGDDTDLVAFPGVGAAGIQFDILAPTVQEVSIDINITLAEGVAITNVKDDIISAITGYINNLGVGGDVIVSEIIERIMGVNNVTDVEIITPTDNIPIADNELARTRSSLITIG